MCVWLLLLMGVTVAFGARDDVITTSVFAKKARDYHREKGVPESFRLINGGMLRGTTRDETVGAVKFEQLAKLVIAHLAQQNFVPSGEAERADLLIFVHWGRTVPFGDNTYAVARDQLMNTLNERNIVPGEVADGTAVRNPDGTPSAGTALAPDLRQAEEERMADEVSAGLTTLHMFNRQREEANAWNARILGYMDEINRRNGPARWAGGGSHYDDLIADIEEPRYYVILTAYDVAQTNREGRPKLQWVTRISIRAQGNRFGDKLVAMLAAGARYYGKDSGQLIRRYERTPRVEIGEATVVGVVPGAPREAEAEAERGR